jgi:hypothetical protein
MNIKALGIDIAKNVFELHGVDKNGKVVLKKRVSRDKLPEVISPVTCLFNWHGSLWWIALQGKEI